MEMHEVMEIRREKTARSWSKTEKILLGVSLLIAVLFDRLVINQIGAAFSGARGDGWPGLVSGIFWLCYLIAFYVFYWKRVKRDAVAWLVSACVAALVVWNFIYYDAGNWQFSVITFFVIPAVLMAHAQWTAFSFSWKNFDSAIIGMVLAWLEGWIIKPFTALPICVGVSASLVSDENRPAAKRAAIGFAVAFGLMLVIIPLLMGADQVFGHFVSQIFSRLRFSSIIFHGFVITAACGLFYSFLWNVGFGKNEAHAAANAEKIDNVISGIVLGSVIFVYSLFCAVQFTYLFARAGLPEGMTFAEYAREGFAQTVAVCAINLLIFGVFLWRGNRRKLMTGLLAALLSLTGIKLISGAIRLHLYIDAFGMTWLRLLSAWFIIYLAVVVILCAVRLAKKEMPVVGISVLLLLVWYVALGYLNPDRFIGWYNKEVFIP